MLRNINKFKPLLFKMFMFASNHLRNSIYKSHGHQIFARLQELDFLQPRRQLELFGAC